MLLQREELGFERFDTHLGGCTQAAIEWIAHSSRHCAEVIVWDLKLLVRVLVEPAHFH